MWVHPGKRIAFIAHPRTGSREIGFEILARRGFERFLGHHGVPWGGEYPHPPQHERDGPQFWWYSQDVLRWRFYAAHRNHFEVFHSIAYVLGGRHVASAQRLSTYVWQHAAVYRSAHTLFPAFHEVAGCQPLRFDHLRDDVAQMLAECDLRPLGDDEGHRDASIHITHAKPRGEHYSAFLSPDVRAWIEASYSAEMERLGYAWEERETAPDPPGAGSRPSPV